MRQNSEAVVNAALGEALCAIALWANTTLGLMAFWWLGSRQHQGRAVTTLSNLPQLTMLDPRALTPEQLSCADGIFERFQAEPLLAANEAYRDDARKALDRAVLVDMLGVSEEALAPLDNLRSQWCAEPSVHGGKESPQPGSARGLPLARKSVPNAPELPLIKPARQAAR